MSRLWMQVFGLIWALAPSTLRVGCRAVQRCPGCTRGSLGGVAQDPAQQSSAPCAGRSVAARRGPCFSWLALACVGRRRSCAIAQLHLQMLCTGVHEQPAGEMLAKSGGFCRRSAPRARGRGSSHVPVWPGAPPPSPHSTALSTAKAVYKSNRGCHHVPRRRHTNLIVAAATCREGGI